MTVLDGEVGTTVGVEEEFHVLDPETGDLVPAARQVLRSGASITLLPLDVTRKLVFSPSDLLELPAAESRTCRFLRQIVPFGIGATSNLYGLEGFHLTDSLGLTIASVGTVPASGSGGSRVFPDRRYEWMAAEYRNLVDEQQVCACQVHVRVDDRDLAVRITRRIRAWLPALLALTASSPYFQGGDTGYASYRTVVVSRWPTVGPPPDFASAQEYDRTVETLIGSGVISDAGMIYFDARLSAHYPTVEIRVADACPSVDDAVLLAALGRALVVTAARADTGEVPHSPQVLARAATWRAARSGLDGCLIHPDTLRPVPAAEVVQALLDHTRSALEEHDDWSTAAEQTKALLAHGPSARRQRDAHATGMPLSDVVANLAARTTAG